MQRSPPPESEDRRVHGYTVSSRRKVVTSPPTIGAAIRFMTSAPVPVLHSTGMSPMIIVATVINVGRRRLAAPSTIASRSSVNVPTRPSRVRRSYASVR